MTDSSRHSERLREIRAYLAEDAAIDDMPRTHPSSPTPMLRDLLAAYDGLVEQYKDLAIRADERLKVIEEKDAAIERWHREALDWQQAKSEADSEYEGLQEQLEAARTRFAAMEREGDEIDGQETRERLALRIGHMAGMAQRGKAELTASPPKITQAELDAWKAEKDAAYGAASSPAISPEANA